MCDSSYQYLIDKCRRLDNLPSYCNTMLLDYGINRLAQRQCILNPPLPNDTKGVKNCIKYIDFDSTYYHLPPKLIITGIDIEGNENKTLELEQILKGQIDNTTDRNNKSVIVRTNFTIENPGINGIHVIGISFNIIQNGNKILSDRSSGLDPKCLTNYIGCTEYEIDGLTSYPILIESKAQSGNISFKDSKYLVNGYFDYKYDDSNTVVTKSFATNYP